MQWGNSMRRLLGGHLAALSLLTRLLRDTNFESMVSLSVIIMKFYSPREESQGSSLSLGHEFGHRSIFFCKNATYKSKGNPNDKIQIPNECQNPNFKENWRPKTFGI